MSIVTAGLRAADELPHASASALSVVFEALDEAHVPYVVLHGYENYPEQISSDVDLLMPREVVLRQMRELLKTLEQRCGMRLVQWIRDDAHYIVLADEDARLLCLHIYSEYRCFGRVMYRGAELLAGRRSYKNFWIPAPAMEFCCTLGRRIEKDKFREQDAIRLTMLYEAAPEDCRKQLPEFWKAWEMASIVSCAETGDWSAIAEQLEIFRLKRRRRSEIGSRVRRWLRPPGLHVVFLGPDGVGKSTVIDLVQHEIAPAFFSSSYRTYAPMVLRRSPPAGKGPRPHSLPMRGRAASLLKAGYWAIYYTLGYFVTAYRDRARGMLAINHRYLVDALVDARRYRYSGPKWILWAIWKISPKPDLVLLLDAPTEVIQARKSEVTPEETTSQLEKYRALVGPMRNGRIINAAQSVEGVVLDVKRAILDALAERTVRRMGKADA